MWLWWSKGGNFSSSKRTQKVKEDLLHMSSHTAWSAQEPAVAVSPWPGSMSFGVVVVVQMTDLG